MVHFKYHSFHKNGTRTDIFFIETYTFEYEQNFFTNERQLFILITV